MKKQIRFAAAFAVLMVMSGIGVVHAGGIASARMGKVLDVQFAQATENQVDDHDRYGSPRYSRYEDSYQRQPQRSYAGAAIGGAVGAILGSVAGRHSSVGRAVGGFGLAAIGTALGNEIDQRRYERRQEEIQQDSERSSYEGQASRQRYNSGAQVIVSVEGGQTFAVFVRNAAQFHIGQKVWVVDNSELIPANS